MKAKIQKKSQDKNTVTLDNFVIKFNFKIILAKTVRAVKLLDFGFLRKLVLKMKETNFSCSDFVNKKTLFSMPVSNVALISRT